MNYSAELTLNRRRGVKADPLGAFFSTAWGGSAISCGEVQPPTPLANTALQKGVYPLKISTKFGLGEGVTGTHAPSRQILTLWLYRCGLAARKIAKIGNFWYMFAPKGYIPFINFLQNLAWGRIRRQAILDVQKRHFLSSRCLLAGDIALLSCSCYGLQKLIDICYAYEVQWILNLSPRNVRLQLLVVTPLLCPSNWATLPWVGSAMWSILAVIF